jgi:hypothetical protein
MKMINAEEAWRISSEAYQKQWEERRQQQCKEDEKKINDVNELYQKVTSSLEKKIKEGPDAYYVYSFYTKNEFLVDYVFEKLTGLGYEVIKEKYVDYLGWGPSCEIIDEQNTNSRGHIVTIKWSKDYKKPEAPKETIGAKGIILILFISWVILSGLFDLVKYIFRVFS